MLSSDNFKKSYGSGYNWSPQVVRLWLPHVAQNKLTLNNSCTYDIYIYVAAVRSIEIVMLYNTNNIQIILFRH